MQNETRVSTLVGSILQTEQGEVGWANVWKTQGGAVRYLTNIYSLSTTLKEAFEANDEKIMKCVKLQPDLRAGPVQPKPEKAPAPKNLYYQRAQLFFLLIIECK